MSPTSSPWLNFLHCKYDIRNPQTQPFSRCSTQYAPSRHEASELTSTSTAGENALFTSPARIPGPFKAITCHQKGAGTFVMMSILKPSPFFSFEILPGTCFHDSNRWRKLDPKGDRVTCIQVWQLWWLPQANEIPSLPPENGTCGSQVLHDSTWLSGCQKDHLNRLTAKRASCLSLVLLAVVFGAATGEFWGVHFFPLQFRVVKSLE